MTLHSIMVVDDNTDMLHVYARVLAQEGFEVFTAATGNDCLDQIATVRPDIFLLDVVLPDWNGIDLVREIKERPEFVSSMFVLLSGLITDSDSKIKGFDAGALDYMARPIPNKELVAKVKSLVKVMDFQESLMTLSTELDQRVKERTQELETSLEALQREIENRTQLEEQFRQAQKMEAVGTLAGGIAHDFNNILQVISGNAFLKKQKETARGEYSPELTHIIEAVEQGANRTQGLLSFSRRQSLECQPLNLNDLIRRSATLGRRLVEESVSITTAICSDTLTVMADTGLIQQVFFNLITNARDAMNANGSITVRTFLETVGNTFPPGMLSLPTVPPPGDYAVFSVSDTAVGIPPEIIGQIFDPFFTTKEKGKGTGLGLAMIHGTITQHHGFIVVDSLPGKGTTFSIYLCQYEGPWLEKNGSDVPDEPSDRQRQHTILVAEDNASVRDLLATALLSRGYQVVVAESGEEAIEVFRNHQVAVSLILMDIVMPAMNGQKALKRIRELHPDIPCLFISGYGAEIIDSHDVALHDSVIRKPFRLPDLMKKVRTLLEAA